jgi:carboxymethylenebutenolidase
MHALAATLALLSLAVCSTPQDPQPRGLGASRVSGSVSEEEFKRMHELRKDAPPKLEGTMIELAGTKAYLTLPKTPRANSAGMVVVHEWWGLNDNVKHWADRLAAEGYSAIAVDLYSGVVATTSDDAMAAMKKVEREKAVEVMKAAERFLRTDERTKAKKVGSVGWCFGGGMSLALALNSDTLDAAVMYYGQPETDPKALAALKAPLLGIFGSKDKSITPTNVGSFVQALVTAGKEHTVMSFYAEHAFANPSNPRYDEKSASVAWDNVRAFLAAHL